MTTLSIGKRNFILLLGGGQIMIDLGTWLNQQGINFLIVTSPRHANTNFGDSLYSFEAQLESLRLPFIVTDDWKSIFDSQLIEKMQSGIAISLGASWIFKQSDITQYFNNHLYNAHGTRLPTYRGGGGFSWQILNGNRYGFCLLHRVGDGIDDGDIIAYEEFLYPATCRKPRDFQEYYQKKTINFLVNLFCKFVQQDTTFSLLSQPPYLAQYWPRLNTEQHGWIDWSYSVEDLDRFICAFDDPYQGAKTLLNNKVVRLKSSLVDYHDGKFHPFQRGLIYRKASQWICVAADHGTLIVEELLDDHGHSILAEVVVGDRFFTPIEQLAKIQARVIYTTTGMRINALAID